MKSALDIHHMLLSRGVHHELVHSHSTALSADDLPRALGVEAHSCVAVRCYTVQECRTADGAAVHLVAVLVRAGDVPDRAALQRELDTPHLRPATPDEVNAHTGFSAAFVSPVCLPEDVVVLADSILTDQSVVYAAVGDGGLALGISTHDLLVASGARVATLTSRPLGALESAPRAPHAAGPDRSTDTTTAQVIALDDRRSNSRRSVS